jgi:antitoxin component of MazEF toxin-antitoxin module
VAVRKPGNSVGVAIPAEMPVRIGFEAGQELTLVALATGGMSEGRHLIF